MVNKETNHSQELPFIPEDILKTVPVFILTIKFRRLAMTTKHFPKTESFLTAI
jgi:hypothetical protein